jgi:predicted dienelactone hydrolase
MMTAALTAEARADYDPLRVGMSKPKFHDLTVKDEARSREIPLRIYLPEGTSPAAVVLFSHGLGGSRAGSAYLGEHWAARGYVVVYMQHAGSDDSVWKNLPPLKRMAAMQKARRAG